MPPDFSQLFYPLFNLSSEAFEFPTCEQLDGFFMPPFDMEAVDPHLFSLLDPTIFQHYQQLSQFLPSLPMMNLPLLEPQPTGLCPSLRLPRPQPSAQKIGPLTAEERTTKLQKFREKRRKRNFSKKVSYACRKSVADSRLRVKGRFITKTQAELLKDSRANASP